MPPGSSSWRSLATDPWLGASVASVVLGMALTGAALWAGRRDDRGEPPVRTFAFGVSLMAVGAVALGVGLLVR